MSPYLAAVFTFLIAIFFLRLMDFLAQRGIIESRLSRKLIHIGTGPIFVLCWLMYPDVQISRWLAALVPLVITTQFALVGTGLIKDEAAVKAMSRTGDRREILRGLFRTRGPASRFCHEKSQSGSRMSGHELERRDTRRVFRNCHTGSIPGPGCESFEIG